MIRHFHDDYQRGASFRLGPLLFQVTITRRITLYVAVAGRSALVTL